MRGKERDVSQDDIQPAANIIIFTSPIFDFDQAIKVTSLVEKEELQAYPSLKLALILIGYNYSMRTKATDEQINKFLKRFTPMVEQEQAASDPQNPLPTIGIEVESPRKLFNQSGYENSNYMTFFDNINMPRNRANAGSNGVDFWEFSPPPSYTSSVQERILCELIKGGFIPSLKNSKEPAHIREYLDDKLVSLHVNLGVPEPYSDQYWVNQEADLKLFASMFPLAYSSPLRLKHRVRVEFYHNKSADSTSKSGGRFGRFELNALEVRDERVYRLMAEAQLLAAAMFCSWGDQYKSLGGIWRQAKNDVSEIYQYYGFESKMLSEKPKISEWLEENDIAKKLRSVISCNARVVKQLIRSYPLVTSTSDVN